MAYTDQDVRITLNWELPNSEAAANVLHAHFDATPAIGDLEDLATTFETWWTNGLGGEPAFKTAFHANTTLVSIQVTQLVGAPPLEHVLAVGTAGDGIGDAPPNESAIVVTWYTGFPGKSFRGRSFFGGYDTDAMLGTDGLVIPSQVVQMQETTQALVDAVGALINDVRLAVNSRTLEVLTPITTTVARSVPHHQSRRNS